MNELREKVSAIREDLVAFQALVPPDPKFVYNERGERSCENNPRVHELAELVEEKMAALVDNFKGLWRYMTESMWPGLFIYCARLYLRTGEDHLTGAVADYVPKILADLDAIEQEIQKNAAPSPETGAAT